MTDIRTTVRSVEKLIIVAGTLVIVGSLLVLFSLSQEFITLSPLFAEDSMKMGPTPPCVGRVLLGIFAALVAILRVLRLMPHRLSDELERTTTGNGDD